MNKKEDLYYSNENSLEKDSESFFKYMDEKANLFEEEINLIYTSLNDIIKGIQSDYPNLDQSSNFYFSKVLTSFS